MSKSMEEEINYISPVEFIEVGFLQEVNRQWFHPRGLALQVDPDSGEMKVWDYRDDPEGIAFVSKTSEGKAVRVDAEYRRHRQARLSKFGWIVQPVGESVEPTDE